MGILEAFDRLTDDPKTFLKTSRSLFTWAKIAGPKFAVWGLPVAIGASWFLYPAFGRDFKKAIGLIKEE